MGEGGGDTSHKAINHTSGKAINREFHTHRNSGVYAVGRKSQASLPLYETQCS